MRRVYRSLAGALALAFAAGALARDDACRATVLRELGWRLADADVAALRAEGGRPCERADLADARRAGDLAATLPRDAAARTRALDALLAHDATRCAFRFRYADATRTAIDALAANDGFRFTGVQAGWISFGLRGAEAQGWTRRASFGRLYTPVDSNTRAVGAFTQGHVRAECGVGRQVAQLATLAALFGPEGFDAAFSRDEVAVGTFVSLERGASVLRGSGAGKMFADGDASESAERGRLALVGAPGFVYHAHDFSTLRDPASQALNFVVYDVDAAATDALRAHGGLDHYDARNAEIWRLARSFEPRDYRGYERLLWQRDAALERNLDARGRETLARVRALLDDPFYRGFRIYVHPHGVKPVGFHIARELDRNPGTPYRIALALHNIDTEIFDRWIAQRMGACEAGRTDPSIATSR